MKTFNYLEKEDRPWGTFYVIQDESNYKIKRLEINPGHRLSYQYHKKRSETWIVIEGNPTVNIEGTIKDYNPGDTIIIPVLSKHRIENNYESIVKILEVQTGTYFGEDDIIRISDDYKRK